MISIAQQTSREQLPVEELQTAVETYLEPVLSRLPDQRLKVVGVLMILGILAGQSPLITQMARGVRDGSQYVTSLARRMYRFIWNGRFTSTTFQTGLYAVGQAVVAGYQADSLVVAIDPVNFEKPYTHDLEGVSTVYKSTPPPLQGRGRLTHGYPSLTACVVNLPEPVVTYAQWFSYTLDFVSENAELQAAANHTRQLYPDHTLCFVGDSGLDDEKYFSHLVSLNSTFIIRVGHDKRLVDVYNERLKCWERESLADLIATMPPLLKLEATFTHARQKRTTRLGLGWLTIRLPGWDTPFWLLAIHDPDLSLDIGLLTNCPLLNAGHAQTVLTTWRYRPQIEHTYRLDQEAGLDVEDLRVQTLEHMRRVFFLVLLAAAFLYHLNQTWQPEALHWLRALGGKLGTLTDLDGLYLLLAGISAVLVTAATLLFIRSNPFPTPKGTCG
jgi:hypothetical protein